jgi:molecular chaperone DnaJ
MEFDLHDALRSFMRDFGDVFGMGAAPRPGRGADLRLTLRVSLLEVLRGTERTLEVRRHVVCTTCHGSGGKEGAAAETCNLCQGRGQVRRVQRSFFGQFVNVGPCPQCGGRGTFISEVCPECEGEGRIQGTARVEVEIPPGVETGNYLTVAGEGETGMRGDPPGDLQVFLEVEEPPGFERHGRDLITVLVLGPALAALGGKLPVPTLEGTATLTIPSGVQHGTLLRMKGKGLPPLHGGTRGSQLVRVEIAIPETLSRESRRLYQELLDLEPGGEDP